MQLSVIVPFHENLENLGRCLAAVQAAARALPATTQLRDTIVVADAAREDAIRRRDGKRSDRAGD
jgi:hypothetical protein